MTCQRRDSQGLVERAQYMGVGTAEALGYAKAEAESAFAGYKVSYKQDFERRVD
jgi:hypothetical protein